MDEIQEITDFTRDASGQMRAVVRQASGLQVVRGVKMASLEGQITRADGTVEPKKLLAVSHYNPVTEARLRAGGVGKVNPPCSG